MELIQYTHIRKLQLEDFDELKMFHVKHFQEYTILDHSFIAYLSLKQYTTYGMFHVKHLIGYAIFLNSGLEADIIYICTEPKFRRMGVATSIIEKYISDERIRNLFIEVEDTNHRAINFYKGLKFEIVGIRYKYIRGHDAYIMVKRIQ